MNGRRSLPPPRPAYPRMPPQTVVVAPAGPTDWPAPVLPVRFPDYGDPSVLYGDPRMPGAGYPMPGRGAAAIASAWGRLSSGDPKGRKTSLTFLSNGRTVQRGETNILQLAGDDCDAQNMIVTLGQPLAVNLPLSQALAQNPSNQRTSQNNAELGDDFAGTGNPLRWPPFEAVVEWGVGGTQMRAVVDFLQGTTVNVTASWIRIGAAVVTGDDLDISGTDAIYELFGLIGPGFTTPSAQKTVYVGSVPAQTESAVFPIPPFARGAYVVGCDESAAPAINVTVATLRFWQGLDGPAGPPGNCVGNFVVTGAQPDAFPVPAGAAYATVVNQMAVASRMSVVYKLSI